MRCFCALLIKMRIQKKIENLEITLRNKNQEIELLNKLISQKEEIIKLQDELILKFQSELKKIKEDIKK